MVFIGPDSDTTEEQTSAQPAKQTAGFIGPDAPEGEAPGYLETFGRAALRNFPMAQQATAAIEPGDYSENLANLTQKAEAAKAENPITYGAGAVTGAAAPLFIPGIGEGLEAAGPILSNAGLGAAQAISDTDLKKNSMQALKEAETGAAIGGGLGGVSQALEGPLTEMFGKVGSKMENENIYKQGNFSGKQVENLRTTLGDDYKEQMGKQLADMYGEQNPGEKIGWGTSTKDLLDSAQASQESTGKMLGLLDKLSDKNGIKYDADGLAKQYDDVILGRYGNSHTNDAQLKLAEKISQDLKELEANPSFQKAHALKTTFQTNAKYAAQTAPESVQPYRAASDLLKSNFIKNYSNNPVSNTEEMAKYPLEKSWVKALTQKLNSEDATTGSDLKSKLSNVSGIAGYGAGHMIGGFPGGMAGGILGANAVDLPLSKLQMMAGRGLQNAGKAVDPAAAELEDYLTRKYGGQQ